MALYSNDMCLLSGPAPDGSSQHRSSDSVDRSRPARCVFPLTRSQEGIWVEYQSNPCSTRYNLTLEWNLERSSSGDGKHAVVDIIKGLYPNHNFTRGRGKRRSSRRCLKETRKRRSKIA
jgi:hypothetical protein